ncbi:N-acetyl-alpha-D-glucosaminyl L-malate synthase [subsurface metagenome]
MENKRLKICYIANGNTIHTERWLRYFASQGHEVHLIPLGECNNDRMPGVIYHELEIKFKVIPKVRGIEKIIKVKRLVKKISPDIIHGHFVSGGGCYAYLSGFKPLVVTAWGSDIYLYSKQLFINKMLTRHTLQNADLITTDSNDLKNKVIKLGASKEKSYIIQFGVDTKLFHPTCDVNILKEELKIGDNEKIIFSPRMIRPIYNIDNIVKAFKLLQGDFGNLRLILKSKTKKDKEYRIYIEELAKRLGVEARIIFIGQVDHSTMPKLYSLSDVVVSIPTTDGTPVSVLEAMACGCNIVASDIPSLQEWIKDGWNGYLVNVKDIEEISQKIKKCLLIKSNKHETIINRNLNIIRERANYFSNMKKMERLYYSLMEENTKCYNTKRKEDKHFSY